MDASIRLSELVELERRDWQLWGLVLFTLLVMTTGVLGFLYPQMHFRRDLAPLPTYFSALWVLIMLLCFYLTQQQMLIKSLRHRTLNEIVERERMELMAIHDPLTQVYNRRYMEHVVEQQASLVAKGGKVGLVVVDVNDFKTINDTMGHQKGDEVLQYIASYLRINLRRHDFVFRSGGDEFIMLLPDCKDTSGIMRRLSDGLSNTGTGVPVSASFGAALWQSETTFESAIAEADANMYATKRSRRPSV